MTLTTELRAQLDALEMAHRRVGLCTVKLLRETLPKRIHEQMTTAELSQVANHMNSMRQEDLTPIIGTDIKTKQAGDVL